MADDGSKYTDEQLEKLEKKIKKVYQEAYKDINDKLSTFESKFVAKSNKYMQMADEGKISWDDYSNWMDGQLFQMEQWESKRDQIIKVMQNANKEASTILNKGTINAFAENANWSHYQIEHDVGVNFGFGLYDAHTVTNLIKNDPQLLPKWKINEKKDYKWNAKKLDNSITQGILQGEGLDDIMHRIADTLKSNNENLMLTFARTAMTGAQNAGRVQGLEDAKDLGIDVVKVWMATLDDHTRASHQQMDGEEQKVGDKWHPFKFSNGCRYPGDPQGPPHEVYNCRCTLVSDVKDYPSEFKRYDNIDGVPVDNMTYKEWKEAKEAGNNTTPSYSQDVYDILSKYKDFDDFFYNAQKDEYGVILDEFNGLLSEKDAISKAMEQAHNMGDQQEEKLKEAQKKLQELQKKVQQEGADKVFSDIWYNQDVTYADWENKKDSIQAKKDYYNKQIKKFQSNIDAGINDTVMLEKMKNKLAELEEFEKNGEEYSKLLQELNDAKQNVKDLTPKPDSPFGPDAYSQERKDNAWWAKSPREADKNFREVCGEVWRDATSEERDAIFEYTQSYHKFNEPLRGIEYGTEKYLGVGNTDLNASYANNGKRLNAMTSIIEKSTYDHDVWLQRGCRWGGMDKFLQCDMNLLQHGSQEEIENELIGKVVTEYGFMSCGSSKGQGFGGNVMLNVYAPSGTKMMYVEPFSAFGDGDGKYWNGSSKQSSFGSELETILQQGTQFRITKVEVQGGGRIRGNSKIWLDIEVIDQSNVQLWHETN